MSFRAWTAHFTTLTMALSLLLVATLFTALVRAEISTQDLDLSEECGTPQDTLCIRSCVFSRLNDWDGGFSGDIHLYFAAAVDSWEALVAFDHELSSFSTWSCQSNSTDPRTVRLFNQPWDGHHTANTTVSISFNAHYTEAREPQMNSVKLNGVEMCVGP